MPTSHSPQVREAVEADEEGPDARAPPEEAADDNPILDVPRGMARPLRVMCVNFQREVEIRQGE